MGNSWIQQQNNQAKQSGKTIRQNNQAKQSGKTIRQRPATI